MSKNTPPNVGKKIKQLRSALNLTLDQMAASSGVSKSMLSQIERNKTNPTVGTLWSLTQALNIDISELLGGKIDTSEKVENITTVRAHKIPEIQSADGKCTLKILGPHDLVSHVEWYEIAFDQGGILSSDPHVGGTREHLTVLEGDIIITTGEEKHILAQGDTARYGADVEHHIKNHGKKKARALLIVYTPH